MAVLEILALPPQEAAPRLLGASVLSRIGGAEVELRLTEVEAYDGELDPGSHAWRGKTPRNMPMYGDPGTIYVYRSYGLHWCMNLTCREEEVAAAVLLRSAVVVSGHEEVQQRRGVSGIRAARGPGNLAQALGATGDLSGQMVGGEIEVTLSTPAPEVRTGPRVGVSRGVELPWRFWVEDPTVSSWRPAKTRRLTPGAQDKSSSRPNI